MAVFDIKVEVHRSRVTTVRPDLARPGEPVLQTGASSPPKKQWKKSIFTGCYAGSFEVPSKLQTRLYIAIKRLTRHGGDEVRKNGGFRRIVDIGRCKAGVGQK